MKDESERKPETPLPAGPHPLGRLQRWMQAVITHPLGLDAGVDGEAARQHIDVSPDELESVVTRSRALSARERLDIYANAYFARLIECLREEFPALKHAVGDELFDEFALRYLHDRPSRSWTLARLGAGMAEHLSLTRPPREGDDPDWADFLVDLATLEWTMGEVYDGPGLEELEPMDVGRLSQVPPERFGDLVFTVGPCLRLLTLRFPVHEYCSAVRKGGDPEIPAAAPTRLAISRKDFIVRRRALEDAEFPLLQSIVRGATLGEALHALDELEVGPDLAADLRRWFAVWAAEGYVVGAKPTDGEPSEN